MASVVDIANLALMRVGAEPIVSLTDDNSRARACNTSWDFVRQNVLRMHSWNSATVRAQLAADITAPLWDFATAYSLPADCLHMMEVDTPYDWRVENGKIVTDTTGTLNVRYVKDETNTEVYDASLTYVMALRMAVEISERINGNRIKRQGLLQEYTIALNDAMADDGEEQSPAEFEEDSWITARF